MKSKAILVALLLLAFGAEAARVSQSEAADAARAWAGSGRPLGVRLGTRVRETHEYAVTNGYSFYAVKMEGGMAIMSSDSELEPVIAFSSNENLNLSEGSPALDLLRKDVALRAALAGSVSAGSASTRPSSSASSRWATLLRLAQVQAAGSKRGLLASAKPLAVVSDVRVAPMVQSKWQQDFADEGKTVVCYNYYTPNNYVCGCTATAMSQVMRYFEWPQAEMEPAEYECKVDGVVVSLATQGGLYDWANMTLVPNDAVQAGEFTEANAQAIGKLASDAGIAVESDYNSTAKGGTGADPKLVANAFRNAFGYPEAICYWNETGWNTGRGGLHEHSLRERVILANLDARQPVQLAIYGYDARGNWAGHAVVADGYGYQEVGGVNTEYVHINMGWAGTDDMWYNIPEINAAASGAHVGDSGLDFLYLGGATFNITPNEANVGLSILSGHVVDDEGVVVPGTKVYVFDENETQVGETTVDENGIYVFRLEGDKAYSLFAESPDGKLIADLDEKVLPATKGMDSSYVVFNADNVGNSWGNDMEIALPSVRVGDAIYTSIDRAVAKSRDSAVPGTPVVMEILEPTKLRKSVTIDFDCILCATNASAYATPARRISDAQFTIVPGVSMLVSNVVFSAGSGPLVDVEEGGVLKLVGTVDFGVQYDEAAVHTVTADGFLLLGGVGVGFTLDCDAATGEGDTFGYGYAKDVAPFEAMCTSAVRIANFSDPVGEQRGLVTGSSPRYPLVWQTQRVPYEDCTGYFIDKDGGTNTAARIDRLFDLYSEAFADGRLGDVRRMVIRRRGSLSRPLAVPDGLSLVGEDVAVVLGEGAGFAHTGGDFSVSGISFSGYRGNAFFFVNGEDAALSLGSVSLADFEGTNKWSGAVTVLKGSLAATGVTFTNCWATGKFSEVRNPCNSSGGAIYMAEGTSLSLADASITGCGAKYLGGGVYALPGASVALSGSLDISGNKAAGIDDDVYLANSTKGHATLLLADEVSGSVGVRWQGETAGYAYGNTSGLLLADAASAAVAHASAAAFFSDVNADVVAEPDDAVPGLRWTDAPTGPQPWQGDPADASARVEYAGGTTEYYLLINEALKAVSGDATIYITGWNGYQFSEDITISHNVTLASDLESGNLGTEDCFWIERAADCSIIVDSGASLTLRDVGVFGSDMIEVEIGGVTFEYPAVYATCPLFNVRGGTLTLATPTPSDVASPHTLVGDAYGGYGNSGARNAGAVSVWQGGTFRMQSGAEMVCCCNYYENPSDGSGRGGAVLVDDGEAVFEGGTITDCTAYTGGGVFVGNNGTISVSGDTIIDGNYDAYGYDNNLVVHDCGRLTLAGKMTGSIGYTEGVSGDKVVFGKAASGVSAADALESAHNFTHDLTGDVGMAVSGPDGMLLVWSDGLDAEGKYSDDEGIYSLVNGDPYEVEVPTAYTDLVYSGEEQAGVPEGVGYIVENGAATNAGDYTATATLRPGYAWDDGTTGAKTVDWSIAKATYDMGGVSFDDMEVPYSGQYFELLISGELPEGVAVSYANNRQMEVGVYTATATFSGDAENYEAIDDMTATLTIAFNSEIPPTPPSGEDPAQPLPVAFTSVLGADGNWTLSLETAVEKCWYSLYETNSISGGFGIEGVAPVEVRQATSADVPTMTFEPRPATGEQLFWKVIAEPEDAR